MNFGELINEVAKENGSGYSNLQVKEVLVTTIKIILEELLVDPINAEVNITNVGIFFIKLRKYKHIPSLGHGEMYYYSLHFQVSDKLKGLINGRTELKNFKVGNIPLYPNENTEREKIIFRESPNDYGTYIREIKKPKKAGRPRKYVEQQTALHEEMQEQVTKEEMERISKIDGHLPSEV